LVFDIAHHSALKSSGTSPNFLITLASLKSPVAGSPVRLNATAPSDLKRAPRPALLPRCNKFFDSFEEQPIQIYVRPATFSIHAFPVTGKGDLQVGPAL
jgi:hypothetical protein